MLKFELINSKELDNYVMKNNVQIIDLREKKQFDKSHIRGAINYSIEKLEREINFFYKNKIYIFYCENGGTGILAAKEFFDHGYTAKALISGFKEYKGKYLEFLY